MAIAKNDKDPVSKIFKEYGVTIEKIKSFLKSQTNYSEEESESKSSSRGDEESIKS